MAMETAVKLVLWSAAAIAAGTILIYGFWRVRSMVRVWRAGERRLHSVRTALWEPRETETLDLAAGPGGRDGAPLPPYTFIEEHFSGSQPCISVRDARGRRWRVKWGDEVQVETLATRLVWAAGYFAEITYFIRDGEIADLPALQRPLPDVHEDGRFKDARFEREEEDAVTHFDEHSWAWNDNPFLGSRELNGLKVVMMWLSNWDAKDVRDVARGSNTAIFEYRRADGLHEAHYLIIDWGGALGRWGSIVSRGRWDCEGFLAESEHFVQGVTDDFVTFGYTGQRTTDIANGIRVSDVQWLMSASLGRLSDTQIAAAIIASGGTPEEVACFTRALRMRLDRLAALANPSATLPDLPVAAAL
jgi:hypothetical protein